MSSLVLKTVDRIHKGGRHRVKDGEKVAPFREICAARVQTRKELAHTVGLRSSSVSVGLQELLNDGMVEERQPHDNANTGLPRPIHSPRNDRSVAISLSVDSREFERVLVNLEGKTLAEEVRIVASEAGNSELECTTASKGITAVLLHWGFWIWIAVSSYGMLLSSLIGRIGEIGHSRLNPHACAQCLRGARGCLETVAALSASLRELRQCLGDLPKDEKQLAPMLSAVQQALLVIYKIFYPDLILLSGPFMRNPQVLHSLSDDLLQTLAVIPDSMPGCRHGVANPLYCEALTRFFRIKI
jgi:hypothetical protein